MSDLALGDNSGVVISVTFKNLGDSGEPYSHSDSLTSGAVDADLQRPIQYEEVNDIALECKLVRIFLSACIVPYTYCVRGCWKRKLSEYKHYN